MDIDADVISLSISDLDALAMMLYESESDVHLDIRGLLGLKGLSTEHEMRFMDICKHGRQTWATDPEQLPPWKIKKLKAKPLPVILDVHVEEGE